MKELQSLGLEVTIVDKDGEEHGLKKIEEEEYKEDFQPSLNEDSMIPARKIEKEEFVEEELEYDEQVIFENEMEGEE